MENRCWPIIVRRCGDDAQPLMRTGMRRAHFLIALLSAGAAPAMVRALRLSGEAPTLQFLISVLLFCATGVFLVSVAFGARGDAAKDANKCEHSWLDCLRFDPTRYSLLSGTTFSAMGLSALVFSLSGISGNWEWIFLMCIGLGSYFGAWLSLIFLRR